MMSEEKLAVTIRRPTTATAAVSDGHEIEANSMNSTEDSNDNVNMTDVANENSIADPRRKRSISFLSDGNDVDNVMKKRRGRPAKSSSFHARKPRAHKQKDAEKRKICVDEATAAASKCPPFTMDVGLQTDGSDFPIISVQDANSSSVLLTMSATAAIAESMSKTINEAIEPIVKETGFITIDIKELLINIRQLASQVQVLSAAISSLSLKKPSNVDTMSSDSSDSTDCDDINDDHQGEADFIPASNASSRRRRRRAERKTTGVAPTTAMSQTLPKPADLGCDPVASMYVDIDLKRRRAKNIVVSGIPYSNDDFTYVTNLLAEEFDLHYIPTVSCMRIGKQIDNRLQPLLVTLESDEDAAYLVANARVLRRSRDSMVKQNVFVSADLTPAEAKAAYEIRCRRRELTERRQQTITMGNLATTSSPAVASATAASSTAGRH
jgi:hypothetical protein